MANPIELIKREKHGFDVWQDVLNYAAARTPMKDIPSSDLERMKWYGVFYRKRDTPGTYMLRIRITANELSAAQAKEIARVAYDLAYGIVDITTRANIQVQGLDIADVPRALARLESVGLSAKQTGLDNVRNVFGHPLSGVDPTELIDTRPICRDITGQFFNHRDLADLPRKFNIATSGRRDHAVHYWTQDLSFLATEHNGRVGFRVLIGGKQGQTPQLGRLLPIFLPVQAAAPFAGAILELFRTQGSREKRDAARFHHLIDSLGVDGVLADVEQRLACRFDRCDSDDNPAPAGYDELAGWLPQKEASNWALGLCPALGRMSWLQLEGVGLISERWTAGRLRTTPEQGLVLLDVPTEARNPIATQLAHWNLTVHADSRVRSVVACTGKQFCNIAVTETKAHALALIESLRQRSLELHGIRIHMSGCPSACANHHTADIGLKGVRVKRLLGTREGFDVFLGGGVAGVMHTALPYRMGVDVGQLPNLIDDVVREYYLRHTPGESFSEYWREKLAREQAADTKEDEFQTPLWECEHCGHKHSGVDPPVYCPQCAALRRYFARLEEGTTSTNGHHTATSSAIAVDGDGFAAAAKAAAVPADRGLFVRVGEQELALFRVAGRIVAIDNSCPHAGGSLAEGAVADGCVTCPLHGWKFDASTGAGMSPAKANVASFHTKVVDGQVLVQLARQPS